MQKIMMQLITAAIGSVGFGMIFRLRRRLLPPAALGGFMSWGIYLFAMAKMNNEAVSCLFAAGFSAIYAEILARIEKAPATIFLVTSVIPLIPGSTLYYTMSYAVQSKWEISREYGSLTIQYAVGIAGGISLAWALCYMLTYMWEHKSK